MCFFLLSKSSEPLAWKGNCGHAIQMYSFQQTLYAGCEPSAALDMGLHKEGRNVPASEALVGVRVTNCCIAVCVAHWWSSGVSLPGSFPWFLCSSTASLRHSTCHTVVNLSFCSLVSPLDCELEGRII